MRAIKRLSFLIFFTLSTVIFYSCETSNPITGVNQDVIYQIYDARYNADSNWSYARATFRLNNSGGSYVTLTGANAGVTFNSNPMTEISLLGVVFYQFAGTNFLNPFSFVYTNADNQSFSNSTSLSAMSISFQNPPAVVSQSMDLTLQFTSSVSSGEKVTLEIYNVNTGSLVITRVNQTGGSNSFTITSAELSQLATGPYRAFLTRQDQVGLSQQNSVGGVMNRAYVSTRADFILQ